MDTLFSDKIAINQLGYRQLDCKQAIIQDYCGAFAVVDTTSKEPVWQGITTSLQADRSSGVSVSKADFSSLSNSGTYQIVLENNEVSYPFSIRNDVYVDAHKALLKAFYYLRCGVELEEAYAHEWKHGPCHLGLAHVHGDYNKQFDGCGGWHDAGDYGKYIVAAGKAVADLLLAFEWYPSSFAASIPLPESNDVMSDVLHECKVELDWMLKMQDLETGGVYHKLTTLQFPPFDMMPELDLADLVASPISATATGSFAATLALAARVYAPYDQSYAELCIERAQYAWGWLERNPNATGFRNPADVGTGEYGDEMDLDERYWAAAELYRTTGDEKYHKAFKEYANKSQFPLFELGWVNVSGYGTLSYLTSDRPKDKELSEQLKAGWQERAEQLALISAQDGYGLSLLPEHYIWGSNMVVMNNAMILLIADALFETTRYQGIVAQHIHYTFGTNVMGISYVTGFGSKPMMNPHHRPSIGDDVEHPVPGMLSGGPNKNLQDEIATAKLQGAAPAASFIDHIESYATNEITIYWNSPAVFVLSAFV